MHMDSEITNLYVCFWATEYVEDMATQEIEVEAEWGHLVQSAPAMLTRSVS